ncbi:IniB N-terminal domain-containing protein [Actinomycetospora sp. OC33-EN08]|uniref:IniB N-terminal domain-containing protein n=1 Tax=Actinomycetospora aurantiaca TaxID=3129233 RepID=A0ABU8MJR8_9PSEU
MAGAPPATTVLPTPLAAARRERHTFDAWGHTMVAEKTLLEFLLDLLSDKEALAAFKEDPEGALKAAGLEHVCVEDIQDLVPVVLEKCSPEDCAKYEDDCDDDKCHDDEWRECREDEHWTGKHHDECDDDHGHHGNSHHDYEMHKVITHLTYVTNNFTIDNSINVWNAGDGDVLIVNGDGNIIGDNNVTGDGNTIGDGNGSGNVGDGAVVGDFNGSGNISGELNLDLGLLPELPPLVLPGGSLDLPLDVDVPDSPAALTSQVASTESSESEPTSVEEPEPTHETEDHGSYTEVNGHGNIIGDDNVTGHGNTIGDGNGSNNIGDGAVVGNGNGSGNVDLSADVDLGGDDVEVPIQDGAGV